MSRGPWKAETFRRHAEEYTGPARHLEVLIQGSTASDFAAISAFLEERGFHLAESRHGDVYRLFAERRRTGPDPSRPLRLPRLRPVQDGPIDARALEGSEGIVDWP